MSGLKQQIEKKAEWRCRTCGQSFDDFEEADRHTDKMIYHKLVGEVDVSDVLGLLADYVCIPKKQWSEHMHNLLDSVLNWRDGKYPQGTTLTQVIALWQSKMLGDEK